MFSTDRLSRFLTGLAALLRAHHRFAPPTQLVDADYLRERLRLEYERAPGGCHLLMLDIDAFHLINRDYGQREGDSVLQAVTHTLLLNLRPTDLLCRYAGDRFAVLVTHADPDAARALADQLRRAVATLRHHTRRSGQPIQVSMRHATRTVDVDPRQLLKELNRALERRMSSLVSANDSPLQAARRA